LKLGVGFVLKLLVKVVFIVFFFGPIVLCAINSLRPHWAIVTNSLNFVPTIENYMSLMATGLEQFAFGRYFINSAIIAGGATVFGTVVSLPAAYALSRLKVANLGVFFLSFRFLPITTVLLPIFILWQFLGLVDTYQGMILLYMIIVVPYTVWMMQIYFNEIPDEIFQAAQIDGYSNLEILFRIMLPACLPGFLVTVWISFLFCWNEFFLALVLSGTSAETAPVACSFFLGTLGIGHRWGELSAAGILMSIPLFIFIAFTQKYFVKALSFGLVK